MRRERISKWVASTNILKEDKGESVTRISPPFIFNSIGVNCDCPPTTNSKLLGADATPPSPPPLLLFNLYLLSIYL